jgi:hypothetical protein
MRLEYNGEAQRLMLHGCLKMVEAFDSLQRPFA